jgi:hypothetical protein
MTRKGRHLITTGDSFVPYIHHPYYASSLGYVHSWYFVCLLPQTRGYFDFFLLGFLLLIVALT